MFMNRSDLPPLPTPSPWKVQSTTKQVPKINTLATPMKEKVTREPLISTSPTTSPNRTYKQVMTTKETIVGKRPTNVENNVSLILIITFVILIIIILLCIGVIWWCFCRNKTSKDSQGN